MSGLLLVTWLLAATASPSDEIAECIKIHSRTSIWEKARTPKHARYCYLLAAAESQIRDSPRRSSATAEKAHQLFPDRAAPYEVKARAAVIAGKYQQAVGFFEKAKELDPRSLQHPRSLLPFAQALRLTGKSKEATEIYRLLVPRIGLLSEVDRGPALHQAALSLLEEGPGSIDGALAILRVALQHGTPSGRSVTSALLALTYDRKGLALDVDGLAARALKRNALTRLKLLKKFKFQEVEAAEARLLETSDRKEAAKTWKSYLSHVPKNAPWVAHAQKHIDQMEGGSGKRRRGH
jgi:tetratricopeptide (TPR) repeat protein